jgi:hypothetical protein
MRLINLANLGDLARSGSVPGKKVLRIYSGTPSRLLGLPGFAGFCKSIAAKRDQKALGSSKWGCISETSFPAANARVQEEEMADATGSKLLYDGILCTVTSKHIFYLDPAGRGVISGRSPC